MNTDLVAGKELFRINNMEDVLRPQASEFEPKWRREFNLHKSFEQSEPDSLRGKIWRKATAKSRDEALVYSEDTSKLQLKFRKYILFESENFVQMLALYSCHLGFDQDYLYTSKGDAGEEQLVFPLKFRNDSCYDEKRRKIPKV